MGIQLDSNNDKILMEFHENTTGRNYLFRVVSRGEKVIYQEFMNGLIIRNRPYDGLPRATSSLISGIKSLVKGA